MEIRLVKESKPNLGQLAEARFRIFHNLRVIGELEPATASFLAANGPQKLLTKRHLFLLHTPDGRGVEVTMTEPKSEGRPYLSFPEPVRLFCVEIDILHSNQQMFAEKTEDEVMQVLTELLELAPGGELFVEQGKHIICIRLQEGKILFLVANPSGSGARGKGELKPEIGLAARKNGKQPEPSYA